MYVVEAPSFIVPYVYEKPPITSLKEFVDEIEKAVKEEKEQEEKEAKLRKKKEEEEKAAAAEAGGEAEGEQTEKMDTDGSDKEGAAPPSKSDTETDEEVKESDEDLKKKETASTGALEEDKGKKKLGDTYFDNPLGKFFMQIGVNLVQEFVQTDLLRNQKRKRDRDGKNCPAEVHVAISSLLRTLECSKENNEPFKMELKKCNLCSFKTESDLVMAHHLETPHMRNYVYRCNFCTMEVRSPHDILFHMEAVHNVRGRLERAPAFHQCPNCPFEDNQKGKLSRHLLSCAKKYKPERNQEPPLDWEPPAKIPRMRGAGGSGGRLGAGSLAGMAAAAGTGLYPVGGSGVGGHRGRGRPPISVNRYMSDVRATPSAAAAATVAHQKLLSQIRPANCQPPVLLPTSYQISSNSQLFQNKPNSSSSAATAKLLQQPSISITPLPRQGSGSGSGGVVGQQHMSKPGRPPGSSKATFVICEICDGYIKDLEQLRNHMQWIHKVKIHPKMIYNRPPLNCQKCQFRFFTDQGLERHLLGSHGLVTSSMQEAANKGKDGGRCPVCGRVYQWKLLNHVARDHNMSLKPAHLSYKCTVCTATFGMYKQFENHVYSAHSVVAKRVMDKKSSQPSTSGNSAAQNESLLKPLKINDEITIIPQPARAKTKPVTVQQKTNKVRMSYGLFKR
ncbi:hypothetical protein AAG570_004650 [Ranatra chinensis]|uniref:MOG interacting and ectopic P-granules protein 1 n=1 Tax=Ranatra chinensis TaxID=642074 RepID=A0ABD0Y1G2_9HEMI